MQTSTGFNHAEGQAAGIDGPKELPAQMLDHATGYLMAFGAMMAKARQAREGGSWHVRVSLAQTGRWLWNLGRVADGLKTPDLKSDAVEPFMEDLPSAFGPLHSVKHSAILSKTPAHWDRPAVRLGTHPPEWPARAEGPAAGDQAKILPPGAEREELLRKARQTETASHMSEWLSSPGFQPPK